ncbi:hypothetical protein R1sor_022332 [Riccia sorocarpa]|uniref:Reverse transcriptase domain-containing protein n=1 Tax=Riccia sorocarpa TaxID=122646 RepID=A0ABD3GNC8_9MARC
MLPEASTYMAKSSLGKERVVLILKSTFPVLEWRTCTRGHAVWIKLQVDDKIIGIVNLHAPNKRRPRIETWRWLSGLIHEGNWIVCGDFNQVDRVRDSVGPSPRIHGREERVWSNILLNKDLSDCYIEASTRSGPRFTRQARSGRRLDRSRLDRVYISDRGSWLENITSMKHFGGHIASDHIPILATLQLVATMEEVQTRKHSYFKLNAKILKQPEVREKVKEKVKEIWADHLRDCTDGRRRWNRAWSRIRDYCRDLQRQNASQEKIQQLKREVDERRRYLPCNCTEEEIQELTALEDSLQELENQDAALWVLRSRSKWLREGEAPTKFFFELAKSRFAKDKISVLQKESGETISRSSDILQTIEEYYSELYNAESEQVENRLARQTILQLVDRQISIEAGVNLNSKPTEEEIDDTVNSMKKGKAPGLDGVTQDFILELKPHLPYLVDGEQTGFVPGRHIDDNILTLRLAEEWSKISGESNLFVKLDFTKAFDRVSHTFLWHTLRKMGIPEDTISRIRGLMAGGTSKVHVNQTFTSAIKIKRGVRQGCPLAPLLFVLSTQPLMRILRKEEESGNLRGIQIPGMKSILQELFADDTSLFIHASARDFQRARVCIETFEKAPGALLNVQKSMVMALGVPRPMNWLRDSGCEVAGSSRRFKYLRIWSGRGVSQMEITEKIVISIEAKFKLWANRYLSFTSRILLIKHVLSAIPAHYLMTVGLDTKGLGKLNRTIRQFLWGFREGGKPKTALIGWQKIHRTKEEGGLGWVDLNDRMIAQLASKLENGPRKLKWSSVRDMISPEGGWKSLEAELLKDSWFPEEWDKRALSLAWEKLWKCHPTPESIESISCWEWKHCQHLQDYRSAKGRDLLKGKRAEDNTRRTLTWFDVEERPHIWAKIWSTCAPLRTKIAVWRLLREGFFSNARALRMQVGDGLWCSSNLETIDHMFWQCNRLHRRRSALLDLLQSIEKKHIDRINSLCELIQLYVTSPKTDLIILVIAAEWTHTTWKERNSMQFSDKKSTAPLQIIIDLALSSLHHIKASSCDNEKARQRNAAILHLQSWRRPTSSPDNLEDTPTENSRLTSDTTEESSTDESPSSDSTDSDVSPTRALPDLQRSPRTVVRLVPSRTETLL